LEDVDVSGGEIFVILLQLVDEGLVLLFGDLEPAER